VDVFAEHGNVVGGFFEQILMVHFSDSDFKFLIISRNRLKSRSWHLSTLLAPLQSWTVRHHHLEG
jgi:hypothetical protein